jgi:hypothetical protein
VEAEKFLKEVVAFRPVQARREPELLLGAIDCLCAELGEADGATELSVGGSALSRGDGARDLLSPEEEQLVVAMRESLAKIAAAAGAASGREAGRAVCTALDGAEMVIRGALTSGKVAELAPLTPSFVFLVTLPVLDQDGALALSQRSAELIEAAFAD